MTNFEQISRTKLQVVLGVETDALEVLDEVLVLVDIEPPIG